MPNLLLYFTQTNNKDLIVLVNDLFCATFWNCLLKCPAHLDIFSSKPFHLSFIN
uniref:Uncharacterized protein n=1 Tax=Parascaris univalens TaxID=6257 RepID=A0A915A9N4_PARUN